MERLGRILDINLTEETVHSREYSGRNAEEVLGGFGFNTRLLYEEMLRGDPLGPENILVISLGLLTGTAAPSSSRIHINARSPQSGLMGSSSTGGFLGVKLRNLGIVSIIFRGRAPRPLYLFISDHSVELRDASSLWGLETGETEKKLKEELKEPDAEILSIGPAGENLVLYACVMLGADHAAGRTGLGAVMGSKNLKALAVTGSRKAEKPSPESAEIIGDYIKNIKANESRYHDLSRLGSAGDILEMNNLGALGTRNYRENQFFGAEKIDGRALMPLVVKKVSCHRCPVHCKAVLKVKNGQHSGFTGGRPEFETIMSIGSLCGLDDPDEVVYLSNLCNELGLDTISAGSLIAFAMDLFERGIITEEDTGGLALPWGSGNTMETLLRRIAARDGFGEILSRGVLGAARILGGDAEKHAYHVKGVEIYGTDPRCMMGIALAYAVSLRGGDFTSVYPIQELRYTPEQGKREYGTEESVNPRLTGGKGRLVRHSMIVSAVMDSLGLCKVPLLSIIGDFTLKNEAELIRGLTGLEIPAPRLFEIGERIINMEKLFNLRFGGDRSRDSLPDKFLYEPVQEGPFRGAVIDLEPMITDFYSAMNWDDRGVPKPEHLRALGIVKPSS